MLVEYVKPNLLKRNNSDFIKIQNMTMCRYLGVWVSFGII